MYCELPEAQADASVEKERVTWLHMVSLPGYFNPDGRRRTGRKLKQIPIIHRTWHARLDNITDDGRWKEDESFTLNGELIGQRAGSTVPSQLLIEWRKPRRKEPALFESVPIWSQPSGNIEIQ